MNYQYNTTPQSRQTLNALWKLGKIILDTLEFDKVVQEVTDSMLNELGYLNLGYRIIVLALEDEQKKNLVRISASQRPETQKALNTLQVELKDIVIPFSATDNLCIKVYNSQEPASTHSWPDIMSPPLDPEIAIQGQKAADIKTSMVYPLIVKGKSIGIMIFSIIKNEDEVSSSEKDLLRGFTDIVGIAVQNSQLYTKLEHTTEQLNQANEHLKQLDRLKDEFVSIASHELRTPMTAIKSYLWMVINKELPKQDMEKCKKAKQYLDRAYGSTERLIALVNDMLDVSRIEGGRVELNPEPLNLCEIAKIVTDEIHSEAITKQLDIIIKPCPDLPHVFADRDKLHQIFINLLGNAMKFTDPGGKITITFTPQNNYVATSVTDTGQGISPEDQKRLFTKFGRLEGSLTAMAKHKGTGLGLYLCKQYIQMMGGKITVESQINQGATFTFTLPITNQ